MAPQAIAILGQMEDTPVQVSHLRSGGCHTWTRVVGLTSNMAWGDSNSGPVSAPGVYLSPTQIMTPPRATPILCQIKYTSVQVSYLWFPGGYHIWPRAPCLTSIVAQEIDLNSGCILALQRLLESNLNNSASPSHSNLVSDGVSQVICLKTLMFLWFEQQPQQIQFILQVR